MTTPPERLECRASAVKTFGLLLATAALLAACWFCTTLPDRVAQVAGWVGLPFFGLGGLMALWQLAGTSPTVVIDADGLDSRRHGAGPIPWQDIESFQVVDVYGTKLLCLRLTDADEFLSRMSTWKRAINAPNRRLGFGDVCIGFVGLSPGIDAAHDAVQRWWWQART